jgi:hypothetical protein
VAKPEPYHFGGAGARGASFKWSRNWSRISLVVSRITILEPETDQFNSAVGRAASFLRSRNQRCISLTVPEPGPQVFGGAGARDASV